VEVKGVNIAHLLLCVYFETLKHFSQEIFSVFGVSVGILDRILTVFF
jgi:hypothetical protein